MIENILLPEWAPSIHPMLVHFPIAIFLLAVLLDVASYFLPKEWWDEKKNLLLYGIATASGVVTYFSGKSAADNVFIEAKTQNLLTRHADWAEITVWFLGIYFIARVGIYLWKKSENQALQIACTLLSFAGVYLIFQTADRGAEMVFGHAVGVQQAQVAEAKIDAPEKEAESMFFKTEQGWRWEVGEDPDAELRENFHWLVGSSGDNNLQFEDLPNQNSGFSFSGDSLNGFFTSHENYQNIQADYYLDLSSFDGKAILSSHVQDQLNYDFVSIHSDGTVMQGRMTDGLTEIFDEGSADISEPVFVRVVEDGTHFRGYVDKEMVVHGHSSAPASGSVGFAFNGSGTLIIDKIEMTKL